MFFLYSQSKRQRKGIKTEHSVNGHRVKGHRVKGHGIKGHIVKEYRVKDIKTVHTDNLCSNFVCVKKTNKL